MASRKQIDANRINAKKGGPKTPAGRAAVRNNAVRHGLTAEHPWLPGESHGPFLEVLNALRDEWKPVGVMENLLVEHIADSYWRRQRITLMEQGLFDVTGGDIEAETKEKFNVLTKQGELYLIVKEDIKKSDMLDRLYKYDARFERSFFKGVKELRSMQAARKAAPDDEIAPEVDEITPEVEETQAEKPEPKKIAEQSQFEPVALPQPPSATPHKPENDAPRELRT